MIVSLRDRLSQSSWGWFSVSMATGGIAVLLSNTPHQFPGLDVIGKIVYIFNLALFLFISISLATRFLSNPNALKESFNDPNEVHFVATCPLAIATIILGASSYGTPACGPWLIVALRVVFWLYVAVAILEGVVHNWWLYHTAMASRQPMAVVRLLPSFPAMLSGTIASVIASDQPSEHAIPIIVGGLTLQGFGFTMSLLVYAEYFFTLNQHGLPSLKERPEMFIAVGPWSFTALALIGMANAVEKLPPGYFVETAGISPSEAVTGQIALVLASLVAIFLWFLAFFCLCISIISMLAPLLDGPLGAGGVPMSLAYWSMVFPNTGFVIATIKIGQVLQSEAVLWVSSVMTALQVAVWLGVGVATLAKIL